jgi:DNA-binding NtrC family response regulator
MEKGVKVLVADDDFFIRDIMSAALMEKAVIAIDGQDALEKIAIWGIECISLVITDIEMPRLNGTGLITKILEMDPGKKFIVMSGHPEWETVVQKTLATAQGKALFLYKPFTFPDLFSTIERALN